MIAFFVYKESDSEVTDKMAYNKRQENMQMEKNVTGNIIELKGITKRYEDNFTAVEDFNLEVRKGEFVTFFRTIRMRKNNYAQNDCGI